MTLVTCPECHANVSDHAAQCPQCGYPLAVAVEPASVRTSISRRFAVGWTVVTGASVLAMWAVGRLVPDLASAVSVGALALLASSIVIWAKTRPHADARAALPSGEAPGRVEERVQALEAQLRGLVAEAEDDAQQIVELQERVDFAERLLTKHRDERPPER